MNWKHAVVAGIAVGLLASTLGRLYSSTFYALRDTKTPLRFAIVRVVLTTALGYACAVRLPPLLGIGLQWGTAGLTASAGVSGWIEFILLRRTINERLGATGIPASLLARLWASGIIAAAAAWAVKIAAGVGNPLLTALMVLAPYGLIYLGMTMVLGVPEARSALARLRR